MYDEPQFVGQPDQPGVHHLSFHDPVQLGDVRTQAIDRRNELGDTGTREQRDIVSRCRVILLLADQLHEFQLRAKFMADAQNLLHLEALEIARV